VTLVMIIALALVAVAIVLTGPIVQAVGGAIGVGDTALTVWDIAKWPVLLVVVGAMIALLYYTAPNVKLPGFRWISVGGFVALVVWIIASAGFALYVANFGSYDKTYGALGGIVTLLIWMWISNLALLFGAELNAERERSRELAAEVPRAEREIQLEPRHEPDRRRTV
jgi:membrane protein